MSATSIHPDLLEATMAAAKRDAQTVTPEGVVTAPLLHGMQWHPVPTHVDDRGAIVELFDPRWDILTEPFAYAYSFTIRPGKAKGWGIHEHNTDRYFMFAGEDELVLYDVRPDSPTYGHLARVRLSEFDRGVITIPPLIWHAHRNLGSRDVVYINFPTKPYSHASPDKHRLPLDTPLIPFSFDGWQGW